MFENVDGQKDDRRRTHWYTISSPMSFWLSELKRYSPLSSLHNNCCLLSYKFALYFTANNMDQDHIAPFIAV